MADEETRTPPVGPTQPSAQPPSEPRAALAPTIDPASLDLTSTDTLRGFAGESIPPQPVPPPGEAPAVGALDLSSILQSRLPSDPTRRVYTNRNLDMAAIDVIGFDMDYTLAQYHQGPMDELSVRMTVEKLIANHGYPEEIREIRTDASFIVRGLVVDKQLGHVCKIDARKIVGRCYHGYQPLSSEQVHSLYGGKPLSLSTERYAFVDTLFSLSETTLLAGIIEHYEGAGGALPWSYRQLFEDIRQSIDEAHADDSLKAEILADLPRYIVRDPELGPTLHKLRSVGKRLFLLTNSEWYYTDAVMRFLLDGAQPFYASWRDYFDFVGVLAKKPRFFVESTPFIELSEDGQELGHAKRYRRRSIYQGGNLIDLEAMLGVAGDRILYVGDHIYGDILRSKKMAWWRTALVVQEMGEAIRLTHVHRESLERIRQLEEAARRLDDEINHHLALLKILGRVQQFLSDFTSPEMQALDIAKGEARREVSSKRGLLKRTLAELELLEAQVDRQFNPYWGRIFRERNERSWFGVQLQVFADIYTGRVSNFLAYSPGQMFRARRIDMPHERY